MKSVNFPFDIIPEPPTRQRSINCAQPVPMARYYTQLTGGEKPVCAGVIKAAAINANGVSSLTMGCVDGLTDGLTDEQL